MASLLSPILKLNSGGGGGGELHNGPEQIRVIPISSGDRKKILVHVILIMENNREDEVGMGGGVSLSLAQWEILPELLPTFFY